MNAPHGDDHAMREKLIELVRSRERIAAATIHKFLDDPAAVWRTPDLDQARWIALGATNVQIRVDVWKMIVETTHCRSDLQYLLDVWTNYRKGKSEAVLRRKPSELKEILEAVAGGFCVLRNYIAAKAIAQKIIAVADRVRCLLAIAQRSGGEQEIETARQAIMALGPSDGQIFLYRLASISGQEEDFQAAERASRAVRRPVGPENVLDWVKIYKMQYLLLKKCVEEADALLQTIEHARERIIASAYLIEATRDEGYFTRLMNDMRTASTPSPRMLKDVASAGLSLPSVDPLRRLASIQRVPWAKCFLIANVARHLRGTVDDLENAPRLWEDTPITQTSSALSELAHAEAHYGKLVEGRATALRITDTRLQVRTFLLLHELAVKTEVAVLEERWSADTSKTP